jgi:sucrose phosphorylase
MRNQVQLIAYASRLGGDLTALRRLLAGPLAGLFGGIHVLPFFTPYDGADAGFDPVDHESVDPRLGDWADIRALGATMDTVADLIVNHISAGSARFQDVWARGDASPYAGMFLTFGSVFPAGASEADLLRVYRPRPGMPFTPIRYADGRRRMVWTTFTSAQLDLDVAHPRTRDYLYGILARLAENGVRLVRLDAVGYAVKTAGTSCFMTAGTLAFIAELSAHAHSLGLRVLSEVRSHYLHQLEIAPHVDRVYDFAIPSLLLHALFTGEDRRLRRWLEIRPANAVTVLDTHDGIGIVDVGPDRADPSVAGLLDRGEIDVLVERIHANSGGTSIRATLATGSNAETYQVNCTMYDAVARDDRRYLLARALQFFVPGVPQVYYVGLLAGGNDTARAARTGEGRDVNRRTYTEAEVAAELDRPVVAALCRLIRLRNAHPAFHGTFRVLAGPPGTIELRWDTAAAYAALRADLAAATYELSFSTQAGAAGTVTDVADLPY